MSAFDRRRRVNSTQLANVCLLSARTGRVRWLIAASVTSSSQILLVSCCSAVIVLAVIVHPARRVRLTAT